MKKIKLFEEYNKSKPDWRSQKGNSYGDLPLEVRQKRHLNTDVLDEFRQTTEYVEKEKLYYNLITNLEKDFKNFVENSDVKISDEQFRELKYSLVAEFGTD